MRLGAAYIAINKVKPLTIPAYKYSFAARGS